MNLKRFYLSALITVIAAIIIFVINYIVGKQNLFLLLNGNLGSVGDILFYVFTLLGDGAIWALFLVVLFIYQKQYLPLLITSFTCCTLITQLIKHSVSYVRPFYAIAQQQLIHTLSWVKPHQNNSFPSGHTAAAFCFFMLLVLLVHKRWILPLGFLYALLVGYSRVYLAQHFPVDVAGGMVVATLSMLISVKVQQWWLNKTTTNIH